MISSTWAAWSAARSEICFEVIEVDSAHGVETAGEGGHGCQAFLYGFGAPLVEVVLGVGLGVGEFARGGAIRDGNA